MGLAKILQASKDWQLFDKEERQKILKQRWSDMVDWGFLDLEQGVDLSVPKPAPTQEQMRRQEAEASRLIILRNERILRKKEAQIQRDFRDILRKHYGKGWDARA